jgi:tetratricopeptide (TPR) repeat protein
MADKTPPPPTASGSRTHRVAVGCFERAEKVLARGDCDYGLRLLHDCCHLDPLNLRYRQALRAAQKRAFEQRRFAPFAFLTTAVRRLRLRIARWRGDHLAVLDWAERILAVRPNDIRTHFAVAEAFDNLNAIPQAVWALEEARRVRPNHLKILRTLAQLCERTGQLRPAIGLWEAIRKVDPRNVEAVDKIRGLSAQALIAKIDVSKPIEATQAEAQETGQHPPAAAPRGADSSPAGASGKAAAAPADRPPSPAPASRAEQEVARLQVRIDADPANPRAHLDLAACHRRADRLDRAREVLQRGRGPTHDDFDLVMELADLEIEQCRRELARAAERLAQRPQDQALAAQRDRLLEEVNARELDWYRRQLAHAPTDKAHALELGVRLCRARRYKDAIPHLQAARAGPAQRVRALLHIAYCFKGLANWDLARRALEDGLKELPREETTLRREFLFELARGAFEHGDLTAAVERGNELAFLDFDYRGIGQLLEEWRGSLQKA